MIKHRNRNLCQDIICFLIVLPLFAGCAGGSSSSVKKDLVDTGQVSVARLETGRTGFVISEKNSIDTALKGLFDQGVSALQSGDYNAAIESFESVVKASPLLSAPYINLAIAYIRSDRDESAEKPLKKALELVAGHPIASHEYGLLLRRTGRFDESRAVYQTALARFPEYFPLRKNLGVLCDLYLNDLRCASMQYEMFLEAQPDDEQVKLWLTEVQVRGGS